MSEETLTAQEAAEYMRKGGQVRDNGGLVYYYVREPHPLWDGILEMVWCYDPRDAKRRCWKHNNLTHFQEQIQNHYIKYDRAKDMDKFFNAEEALEQMRKGAIMDDQEGGRYWITTMSKPYGVPDIDMVFKCGGDVSLPQVVCEASLFPSTCKGCYTLEKWKKDSDDKNFDVEHAVTEMLANKPVTDGTYSYCIENFYSRDGKSVKMVQRYKLGKNKPDLVMLADEWEKENKYRTFCHEQKLLNSVEAEKALGDGFIVRLFNSGYCYTASTVRLPDRSVVAKVFEQIPGTSEIHMICDLKDFATGYRSKKYYILCEETNNK